MEQSDFKEMRDDIKAIGESHNQLKGKYIEISGRLIASEDLNAERYKNLNDKMDKLLNYQSVQNGNVARIKEQFETHKETNNKDISDMNEKFHIINTELQPLRVVLRRPAMWLIILAFLMGSSMYLLNHYQLGSIMKSIPTQNSTQDTIVKK